MRRIRRVNWVIVEDNPNNEYYNYSVRFSVSCVHDADIEDVNDLDLDIIEEQFYI
jgi:hypothetical protein